MFSNKQDSAIPAAGPQTSLPIAREDAQGETRNHTKSGTLDKSGKLDEIDTPWTILNEAHQQEDSPRLLKAQEFILQRYSIAVLGYFCAVTKDQQLAQDLTQEFAYRFLRGDFIKAVPKAGKFRAYLKRSLHNLAVDYYRKQNRRLALNQEFQIYLQEQAVEAKDCDDLDVHWRDAILLHVWQRFREEQSESELPYYEILKQRAMNPELDIRQLIESMNLGERSQASIRKILSRARQRFCELLWQEVAQFCGSHDPAIIEEELRDLGLMRYLQRKKPK